MKTVSNFITFSTRYLLLKKGERIKKTSCGSCYIHVFFAFFSKQISCGKKLKINCRFQLALWQMKNNFWKKISLNKIWQKNSFFSQIIFHSFSDFFTSFQATQKLHDVMFRKRARLRGISHWATTNCHKNVT